MRTIEAILVTIVLRSLRDNPEKWQLDEEGCLATSVTIMQTNVIQILVDREYRLYFYFVGKDQATAPEQLLASDLLKEHFEQLKALVDKRYGEEELQKALQVIEEAYQWGKPLSASVSDASLVHWARKLFKKEK